MSIFKYKNLHVRHRKNHPDVTSPLKNSIGNSNRVYTVAKKKRKRKKRRFSHAMRERIYITDWYKIDEIDWERSSHFGAARPKTRDAASSIYEMHRSGTVRGFMRAASFEMQSNDSRSRAPLSYPSQVQRNHRRGNRMIPRARTPTDLNCKLISLLCSQPPRECVYHLSPIRDAVARHASRRTQL